MFAWELSYWHVTECDGTWKNIGLMIIILNECGIIGKPLQRALIRQDK